MTRLLIDNRCATSAREECPAETSSGERKSVKNRRSHGEEVFFERETHCGSHRTEWVGIEPKVRIFWRRQFAVQITIIGQRAARRFPTEDECFSSQQIGRFIISEMEFLSLSVVD